MAHTPGPKLCGRCGEPQPKTQDWFGEAVRMKAINADLLAALKAVEWVAFEDREWSVTDYQCPTCGGTEPRTARDDKGGHAPDCQLAAALAKAKN